MALKTMFQHALAQLGVGGFYLDEVCSQMFKDGPVTTGPYQSREQALNKSTMPSDVPYFYNRYTGYHLFAPKNALAPRQN